jgi:hypothetical protein
MSQQTQDSAEVEAFLADLKLDRYVRLFMDHGFDCMETVMEMEESHMRDIGMAPGHVIKLRKHLAELKPQPTPAPAVAAGGSDTLRRVSFGTTEKVEVPVRPSEDGVGCGAGSSLWDGPGFDEAASAAGFQEALNAWRTGGKSAPAQEPVASAPKVAGSFWSTVGGDEVDLVRASTPLGRVPADISLGGGVDGVATQAGSEAPKSPVSPGGEKICCYQCYKQFFAKYAVERRSPLPDQAMRRFCSEACGDAWIGTQEAKAEALKKRREQIEKMQEMQRALAAENQLVVQDLEADALPAVAVA